MATFETRAVGEQTRMLDAAGYEDEPVVLTLIDVKQMGTRAGVVPGGRRGPAITDSLLAKQGSTANHAAGVRKLVPVDVRGRARAARAAEEAKRIDALSRQRMAEHERIRRAKADAERRLELGRRTLNDRKKHAARQAQAIDLENERLARAIARSKAIFATKEEIDALQGRL